MQFEEMLALWHATKYFKVLWKKYFWLRGRKSLHRKLLVVFYQSIKTFV